MMTPLEFPRDVLLVEDSPGDVRLTREAFQDANPAINLHVVGDGVEAMAFLNKAGKYRRESRPDLILLDLNLPRMDGRQVLAEIKSDESLRTIPTLILSTSSDYGDIMISYKLRANCFLSKPAHLADLESLVRSINEFWITKAKLPYMA
jgi:two-component system, chemotaxis family, response regulator Rcp1